MKDRSLQTLRTIIAGEQDVKEVVRLVRVSNTQALYLIETPFQTFPRFVLGLTDMSNSTPQILLKCTKAEFAQIAFDETRLDYGLPPADD